MNKILTEQYQRKIDGVLRTEKKIIEILNLSKEEYKLHDIHRLRDLRELVKIYISQNTMIGFVSIDGNIGDSYNNLFSILGLHVINQSNEFIRFFDNQNLSGKEYKITQQIISTLQESIINIDKKYRSYNYGNFKSYEDNIYYLNLHTINKRKSGDESEDMGKILNIDSSFSLTINTIPFIKEMSKIYNGKNIGIIDNARENKSGYKFAFDSK